jgi:hypothetical protein
MENILGKFFGTPSQFEITNQGWKCQFLECWCLQLWKKCVFVWVEKATPFTLPSFLFSGAPPRRFQMVGGFRRKFPGRLVRRGM